MEGCVFNAIMMAHGLAVDVDDPQPRKKTA